MYQAPLGGPALEAEDGRGLDVLAAEIKLVAAARVVALQPPLLLEDANVLVGLDVLVVEAPLLDLGLVLTRAVLF